MMNDVIFAYCKYSALMSLPIAVFYYTIEHSFKVPNKVIEWSTLKKSKP